MSDAPDVAIDAPLTVIEHATVVPVDPAQPSVLADGYVIVEADRIREVGRGPVPSLDREVRRVDATETIVMPGLVNAHTHLFQTLFRGLFEGMALIEWLGAIYRTGSELTAELIRLAAELGALESLLGGVTTVVDHQFLHRENEFVVATIDGLRAAGIRAGVARTIIDVEGPAPAEAVETPEAGLRFMDELLAAYPADDSRMLTLMTGPNTPGVSSSAELVRATAAYARDRRIGVSMHVAESAPVVDRVREREGTAGVARWLGELGALGSNVIAAHSVHLDADELTLLAANGVTVSHNPVSNLHLGDGIAPAADMLTANVGLALGTDGATSNNTQDMFEVLKVASLLQRVRDSAERHSNRAYLEAATLGGARAIGMADEIGSLTAGKRADLIVVGLRSPSGATVHDVYSHLVHCARAADVRSVMVNGRWVVEDRHHVDMDADALYAAGRRSTAAISAHDRSYGSVR